MSRLLYPEQFGLQNRSEPTKHQLLWDYGSHLAPNFTGQPAQVALCLLYTSDAADE